MRGSEEKNRQFDAMLTRGLERHRENGADCPEPSILAAYYERRLTGAARAECDRHFASCARCQAQLAAIIRSDPEAAPAPRRFGWVFDWRFNLPIGAAIAAILVIAIASAIRPHGEKPSPPMQLASAPQAAQPEAPEAANAPQPMGESAPPPAVIAPSPAAPSAMEPRFAAPLERMEETRPEEVERQASRQEFATKSSATNAAAAAKEESPTTPQPTSPKAATGRMRMHAMEPGQSVQAPEASATAGMLMRSGTPTAAGGGGSAALSLAVVGSAAAPGGAAAGGAASAQMAAVAGPWNVVTTPDGRARWRVGPQGQIVESISGRPQFTGVSADLIAGSAPSGLVGWVIGRPNTILRTIDGGEHWQLTSLPPDSSALTAISAESADSATVSTESGHRSTTSDGGRSWRPD